MYADDQVVERVSQTSYIKHDAGDKGPFKHFMLKEIHEQPDAINNTLAALRLAKDLGYASTLAICNVPGSSLVCESDLAYMMRAGAEIGVASTKTFTVQLIGLMLLVLSIAKHRNVDQETITGVVQGCAACRHSWCRR